METVNIKEEIAQFEEEINSIDYALSSTINRVDSLENRMMHIEHDLNKFRMEMTLMLTHLSDRIDILLPPLI